MKLLRPRFTVRWMMVAVAVVAAMMASAPMISRWAERRRKWFQDEATIHAFAPNVVESLTMPPPIGAGLQVTWDSRHVTYHKTMVTKYEFAARYPWLPVWPDRAEPE
jgi:hypothetical protein